MTAKQFLQQYQHSLDRIRRLQERLNVLRTNFLPSGGRYMKLSSLSPSQRDLSDYVTKYYEIYARWEEAVQDAMDTMAEVCRVIDLVPSEVEREILEYHYIHGMTFVQIADKIHYSDVHTWRLHGEALDHVAEIIS